MQAVLDAGLTSDRLREHDFCDWKALPSMIETDEGLWCSPTGRERLPLMFTLEARKGMTSRAEFLCRLARGDRVHVRSSGVGL